MRCKWCDVVVHQPPTTWNERLCRVCFGLSELYHTLWQFKNFTHYMDGTFLHRIQSKRQPFRIRGIHE